MKANFYFIALAIVLLPGIYFLNNKVHHWSEFIPLGYIAYAFIIGTIAFIRDEKDYRKGKS